MFSVLGQQASGPPPLTVTLCIKITFTIIRGQLAGNSGPFHEQLWYVMNYNKQDSTVDKILANTLIVFATASTLAATFTGDDDGGSRMVG